MRKAYYLENKEKVLESNRRYLLAHKEEILHKRKEWREANKAELLAKRRAYHEANKQRENANRRNYYLRNKQALKHQAREYSKEHPEVHSKTSAKRRTRKLKTVVDATGIAVWMKEIRTKPFVRCHWCGTKVSGRKIHFDHIIPLSKEGSHTIGNLCASCPPCNHSKSARLIAEWICGGQTFLAL